jgi:hypothetical protein
MTWRYVVPANVGTHPMLQRFLDAPEHPDRCRVSPRRATNFLLLRQKKVSKEKATVRFTLIGNT